MRTLLALIVPDMISTGRLLFPPGNFRARAEQLLFPTCGELAHRSSGGQL
jgi:hypothetical protein